VQDWLLQLNFGWAQELCIIMFVWMAKFGAAYGVRTGIHVGVDVLINRLSEGQLRGKFVVFGLLAGALFTGIVGTLGAPSSGRTARTTPVFKPWAWTPATCSKGRPRPTWSGRPGSSTRLCRSAPTLMCFRFLQVAWSASCAPASCRTTTTAMWTAGGGAAAYGARPTTIYRMDDDLHPRASGHGRNA
jgi:C4-dicarboxylate transporter DctQ subunit